MAFVKEIDQNTVDSHQTSPGYVLTFLRWDVRDTKNYEGNPLDVRNPLTVYNDAIQVVVTNSKKSLSPTATTILKGGDINYSTAISPGDFMLVNMLNWEKDAERVRNKSINLQPINRLNDGFKGVFKIQSVVRSINVNPQTGIKTVTYIVTAAGFTEFNNVINYNPAIASAFRKKGTSLYQTQIGDIFANLVKSKPQIQDLIKIIFIALIGKSRKKSSDVNVQNYGNTHYKIPPTLGVLLGTEANYAVDIYNFIIGIWGKSTAAPRNKRENLKKSFNPSIKADGEGSNFYNTGSPIEGNKLVKLEDWNQKKVWSIIDGYSNKVMNETYTTFRISPDSDNVMPTVIVRQKPFTNSHFKIPSGFTVTKFLDLPRWKVSANLLKSLQISKNEAARFNFIQVFTRRLPGLGSIDQALQIAQGNFIEDVGDIERNGLRPYIVTANFNFLNDKNPVIKAKPWAEIVSDWIINGHLKESGSFSFVGIQDPISVGDNLEFDNIVYHIESIVHGMSISPDGRKQFETKMTVSYGIDKRSGQKGPVYSEMEHTDSHTKNIEDFNNERILPGIGEAQDILSIDRVDGEEIGNTKQESFTPSNLRKRRNSPEENTGEVKNPLKDDGEKGK